MRRRLAASGVGTGLRARRRTLRPSASAVPRRGRDRQASKPRVKGLSGTNPYFYRLIQLNIQITN